MRGKNTMTVNVETITEALREYFDRRFADPKPFLTKVVLDQYGTQNATLTFSDAPEPEKPADESPVAPYERAAAVRES